MTFRELFQGFGYFKYSIILCFKRRSLLQLEFYGMEGMDGRMVCVWNAYELRMV